MRGRHKGQRRSAHFTLHKQVQSWTGESGGGRDSASFQYVEITGICIVVNLFPPWMVGLHIDLDYNKVTK